ncbi:MAG: hypothetical protein LBB78_00465 [Spirochaetaceae bacterium]|jgi:hypothetical protein|nr:hypothetical protein [Spirochaetaceae bacterium]
MENQRISAKTIKRTPTVYPNGLSVGITSNNNIILDFVDASGDPGVVLGSYFLELKFAEDMVTIIQNSINRIKGGTVKGESNE